MNTSLDTLNLEEIESINSGIDWNGIGTSMTSCGILGSKIGTVGGSVWISICTIIGGVAGGIIYSIAD